MTVNNTLRGAFFYKQLYQKTIFAIASVLGVGLLYILMMSFIDHQAFPFDYLILVLALAKTGIIAFTTLKQLAKLIKICHSAERLLWVFGLLIAISVFSFATDYTCLYQFDHTTFDSVQAQSETYIYHLYHFVYFSVITFATVGYGDIVPVSEIARLVVMLEIFLSFFLVVFALANIKKIHIKE